MLKYMDVNMYTAAESMCLQTDKCWHGGEVPLAIL